MSIKARPTCSWYNEDRDIFRTQCANVNKILKQARLNYYSEKKASFQRDPKNLFMESKYLLEGPNEGVLLVGKMSADLV